MTGSRHLQVSFAGGELSPEMWSRHDDPRFRSGAARVRNMITHPRGSVARRPGFEHVRECKTGCVAARLLSFRFARDQTLAIEMGVWDDGGTDRGYFRFHSNGGTLLHPRPVDYIDPQSVATIQATDVWDLINPHGLTAGDPIVVTMEATSLTVTPSPLDNDFTTAAPHGFFVGEAVLFRSTLTMPSVGPVPAIGSDTIVSGRIYYIVARTASTFQVATARGGGAIDLTGSGTGTVTAAVMAQPTVAASGEVFPFDCNVTYYAIIHNTTQIKIAATRAEALDGIALDFVGNGSVLFGDFRVHYDYGNGDVVWSGGQPHYCVKRPWGTDPGANFINLADHLETGHGPTGAADYWLIMPGTSAVVTFNTTTNVVDWTTHGLADGDPVTFTTTGALPAELVAGTVYYVRNGGLDVDEFQLSASVIGPVIDFTGSPSATTTAFANGFYEVPHQYERDVLFEVNRAQSNDIMTLTHITRPAAELQRHGATNWIREDVKFAADVAAPPAAAATPFFGETRKVTGCTIATPAVIAVGPVDHLFAAGQVVYLTNTGDIVDGQYIVDVVIDVNRVSLIEFDTGEEVTSGSSTVTGATIRPVDFVEDLATHYAVSAIDLDDKESPVSEETSVDNNLLGAGSYNTVTWAPSSGAARYRIYKKVNGLFGFLGEVDAPAVTFRDDNISPDLSITPPLRDPSLHTSSFVTIDPAVGDTIGWPDNGLEDGAPVIFDADIALPPELVRGVTYYVDNPGEDAFGVRTAAGVRVQLTGVASGAYFAVSGHWPAAVAYFEQRRVFAGPTLRPQDFWLTASGTESELSYNLPVKDSNRIHNRLAARERSQILHAVPVGHLLLLTGSAEFRLTPLDSDALTPTSVAARAPTQVGVSTVAPLVVNNAILFPAARGGHLRELGFVFDSGDYVTGDVSLRATHLFDNRTIVQMAYQQAPHPVAWVVSSSGNLLGFSYVPEEQIAGWHEHDIDGTFLSCTAIAEGDEDRLYVITLRNGVRSIERLGKQRFSTIDDAFYVDSGVSYNGGAAVTQLFVPHLASQAVVILADGLALTGTVAATGILTLATAATTVHVGLAYTSEIRTLPVGLQVDAALGSARAKNVNQVWLRVSDSSTFKVGASLTSLSESAAPTPGVLTTDLVPVMPSGSWNYDGQVYVQQSQPLPLTIAGMTLEVATGG